jgi:hypothetical protein
MGAPFAGGEVVGPALGDIDQKVSWVEKFLAAGAPAVQVRQALGLWLCNSCLSLILAKSKPDGTSSFPFI